MPFWKKSFSKARGVYYPRAIVQGDPVETETIAKDLSRISTVSNSDVQAVLGDIAPVMHARMAQGKSVHIKGLGYFRYVLDTVGVENLEDFDFQKQVKAVRVEFIPERTRTAGGTYTRPLWTATSWNGLSWRRIPKSKTRRVRRKKAVATARSADDKSGNFVKALFKPRTVLLFFRNHPPEPGQP